jgi:hypothetical protein
VSYADKLAANRRLAILKLLMEARGSSNESVLEMALREMGHHAEMTRVYVRAQLTFLERAGCIRIEFFNDKVMVAHLTERGASVATGAIRCDGVAEPGFGD